jgi:hypothetical protein
VREEEADAEYHRHSQERKSTLKRNGGETVVNIESSKSTRNRQPDPPQKGDIAADASTKYKRPYNDISLQESTGFNPYFQPLLNNNNDCITYTI